MAAMHLVSNFAIAIAILGVSSIWIQAEAGAEAEASKATNALVKINSTIAAPGLSQVQKPTIIPGNKNGTIATTAIGNANAAAAAGATTSEVTLGDGNVPAIPAPISSVVPAAPAAPVAAAVPTTTRRPLLQGVRLPCQCANGRCGCCSGMILERFKQKACMNLTYDADETAVTATMSMNERVLYKNTISGKNPDPMCVRVPRFRFIEFCVEFSNIYFAKRNIHMCIDAEANWAEFSLVQWSFDCIRLGASGVAVLGPEEGGGLPIGNSGDDDDDIEDYDENVRSEPLKSDKFSVEKLPNGYVKINFYGNNVK